MGIRTENPYPYYGTEIMKRILPILILFTIFSFGNTSFAQSQFSPIMSKMENSLFGIDYNNQNDEIRLKRLEERVYGTASTKPVQQRLDKLSKDLAADLIGQEIDAKEDTFAKEEDAYKEPIPQADSNINYPIVNELEQGVFNKEFKTMDINKRLSNLEQKVFNKAYNDDLNSRVERLKAAISPQSLLSKNNAEDEWVGADDYSDQEFTSQSTTHNAPSYNRNSSVLDEYETSNDLRIPLSAVEKSVFRKSFPDDTVSNRLTRLEAQIFNSSFTQDEPQTRLDRITSAYKAQKSASKYDNNKFSQNVSTAMQIGAMLLMVLACIL